MVGDRRPLDISYVDVPDENSDPTWIKVARPDIELAGVRSTTIWKLWTLNLVCVNLRIYKTNLYKNGIRFECLMPS